MEKETPENDAQYEGKNERKASPLSGCLIFIILIAVFSCLGGFIIWHYTDTQKAVHAISEKHAKPVNTAVLIPEKLTKIENKFKNFSTSVTERNENSEEEASITLTVDEINLAIAQFKKMEEFKGKMFITKISPDGIEADICFPVKAGFIQTSNRFLNGKMTMVPDIELGSLFPIITEISPNTGSEVPEKMIRFLPQGLFSSYRTDPDLQAVFHKLTAVELKDNQIIVYSNAKDLSSKVAPSLNDGKDNLFLGLCFSQPVV